MRFPGHLLNSWDTHITAQHTPVQELSTVGEITNNILGQNESRDREADKIENS